MARDMSELDEILKNIDALCEAEEKVSVRAFTPSAAYMEYTKEEMESMGLCEAQIEEVNIGLKQQLPVRCYAKNCYNWKQMREIRLGLLENINTQIYENPLYSSEQMREIRMGLMDHMDVTSYAKLVFSAKDMAMARRHLLSAAYRSNPTGYGRECVDDESGIYIRISDDCMLAYMTVPKNTEFTVWDLKRILARNEILYGIIEEQLQKVADGELRGEEVLIAKGLPAKKGKNGRYEYFFNAQLPDSPKVLPDGSVDYTKIIVADKRTTGDVLAKYYPAENGIDGSTVTGICIEGMYGKELQQLHGKGIMRDAEKNVYIAMNDGFVLLDEAIGALNIWNVYVVDGDVNRYNGHITYDGVIHVMGSVSDMAVIEASGNVVVEGYVESAQIKAGENIILKGGMNGDGKGILEAGGRVIGNFFEAVTIHAKGDVEGNYFLNCNVETDGSLIAKGSKSRIMGGNIKTGYYVESVVIGSFGSAATVIDVGNPIWLEGRWAGINRRLAKTEDELRQLNEGKERLCTLFGEEAVKQNALFHKTCLAIRTKEEELSTLDAEKEYLEKISKRAKTAYIKVYGKLQAGVTLIVCGKRKKIGENLSETKIEKDDK